MAIDFKFAEAAEREYLDAVRYYSGTASDLEVAVRFLAAVEDAIATICAAPLVWRIVDKPDVRRYVLRRFPYVIYYRFRTDSQTVEIYAVMHTSRKPDYWRNRNGPAGG
ncbi:type II toxin-antitoxin system RelE/ParE family toxin [Luteolibacter flavescens]|uniref:Type II toxin-antitoxin system RelE/ParE family toxin n=1 Tax=Luteolibacter flavescens TaxID=1859460 RepID=A0ABT3FWW6_9BACT|nr:type II toxin-antitoxin system RelE/ParE family toxin [Luteolibacter flavescens]MCW1887736.1 type II toxin-antitoxin system RelE/ParE family toxin [Luteolibacter flavescens]